MSTEADFAAVLSLVAPVALSFPAIPMPPLTHLHRVADQPEITNVDLMLVEEPSLNSHCCIQVESTVAPSFRWLLREPVRFVSFQFVFSPRLAGSE